MHPGQVAAQNDGFDHAPLRQPVGAPHAGQQAAGQRGGDPAAVQQQGQVAAGAFGDLAPCVPQYGVKHRRVGGGECVVVGPARGLVAHEFAVCFRQGAGRQLQAHGGGRVGQRKGLGLQLTSAIEQQAHTPCAQGMLKAELIQRFLHGILSPYKTEMGGRNLHACQVLVGML